MADVLTGASMRQADEQTIKSGTPSRTLMERAASEALKVLLDKFDTRCVLFLCGGGNNGGDGLAMARFFAEQGGNAHVLYVGKRDSNGNPDIKEMSCECARQFSLLPTTVTLDRTLCTSGITAIVDAIFGIGLSRPVSGYSCEVIQAVAATRIPVLALDIPSGLHCDTGAVSGPVLPATHTVAIAAQKFAHLLYPAARFCGEITTVAIGVRAKEPSAHAMQYDDLRYLPARVPHAHKGTFGRVLIVGGSVGMSGAGYLAAKGALRAGAGLVEILAPYENRVIYQTQLPEAILTLYDPQQPDLSVVRKAIERADAIALGMGLTQNDTARTLVECVLTHATVPTVVDADALNLLAQQPMLLSLHAPERPPLILTPHLMEASRLFCLSVPELISDLPQNAIQLAQRCGSILALKDARTLVSDGTQLFINPFGNSGMATAGSGDVLAGIIASFAAQGATPIDAARLGVLAHALAGDAGCEIRGNHGLMASDIADCLCHVLD